MKKINAAVSTVLFTMLAALAWIGTAQEARAATATAPERMTYQGFLVDGNGLALGNVSPQNYEVIFRIYTLQSGGTLKWSEQQTVTVDKGYFSVLLGEGSDVNGESRPVLSSVFSGSDASDRFIGISVKGIGAGGSDVEILPRLKLVSSPYAYLAANIAPNAIGSASIVDSSIQSADIQDNSITGADILNSTITSSDIADGTILAADLAANSVAASEIAADAVGSSEIADNAVGSSEIATGAVGTSEVLDNSLTQNDLAPGSVGNTELAPQLQLGTGTDGHFGINGYYGNVSFTLVGAPGDDYLTIMQDGPDWRYYLTKAGNGWIFGTLSQASDRRLKQDILPLEGMLDRATKLEPTSYHLKSKPSGPKQIGFIAQDVLEIYPELVSTNLHDQTLALNYSGFGVIAIGAIKELNEKVETLEAEKSALLQRLDALESRVQSLEQ